MAKGKRAKLRRQQQGMESEGGGKGGGSGGGSSDDWQTGPVAEGDGGDDLIEMDTADAGAAAVHKVGGPKKLATKRGARTTKQKARKRKSLERAMAVASRTETKTKKQETVSVKKKGLKKLWTNEKKIE